MKQDRKSIGICEKRLNGSPEQACRGTLHTHSTQPQLSSHNGNNSLHSVLRVPPAAFLLPFLPTLGTILAAAERMQCTHCKHLHTPSKSPSFRPISAQEIGWMNIEQLFFHAIPMQIPKVQPGDTIQAIFGQRPILFICCARSSCYDEESGYFFLYFSLRCCPCYPSANPRFVFGKHDYAADRFTRDSQDNAGKLILFTVKNSDSSSVAALPLLL